MAPAFFSRRILCFFCNSPSKPPQNGPDFYCRSCSCWNRFNSKGEILSDEPAMHDELLNSSSFAKRASPRKDQLPSMYGPGPFCHTCQTNQMLLVHLLSNYIPSPSNLDHERRLKLLPQYRESLHQRYPPVCEKCLPAVEDEIRRKDEMARTKAFDVWLKQSKVNERQRRVSGTPHGRNRLAMELMLWRVRGLLWFVSLFISILASTSAAFGFYPFGFILQYKQLLLIPVILSLLWTVWDPTYAKYRMAQVQGRDIRLKGKKTYNILQMTAWASRLFAISLTTSSWHIKDWDVVHGLSSRQARLYFSFCALLELNILAISYYVLRIHDPPIIRLIDTTTHLSRSPTPIPGVSNTTRSRSSTPSIPESDPFASLSLSSKPVITPTHPVFGLPSLLDIGPLCESKDVDENDMDWTPTSASAGINTSHPHKRDANEIWLRPQRFFPPEKPTGLEHLFERTKLVDDSSMDLRRGASFKIRACTHMWNWRWTYSTSLLSLLISLVYLIWRNSTSTVTVFRLPWLHKPVFH